MGFLKVILVLILFYYLFKIVFRMFGPKIFSYAARKTEERFKEQFGDYQTNRSSQQERVGDVVIDKKPEKAGRKGTEKVGEYIDFEEVE